MKLSQPPNQTAVDTTGTKISVPWAQWFTQLYNIIASPSMQSVYYGDSPNLDAFGRLRVSNPETLFFSQQTRDSDPLHVENYTAGSASATYTQATSSTTLSTVDGTSANRAMRQTRVSWRYQPGKSQLIKMTGTLAKSGTPTGKAVARIGYFSDDNGLFFGRDATGYFVCVRTNTSGSVLETEKVYQANWSLDKMDGSGTSGVKIDFSKEQIFIIDFQWLGTGRVRFGFYTDGDITYCHTFDHANNSTVVYMRSPNLPLRYEVYNQGGAGSLITMECVCTAVESEAGVSNEGGLLFEVDNSNAPISAANSATLTPIMTLRLKDTFDGLTTRSHVNNISLNIFVTGNPCYWEWTYDVATLTSAGGATNELTGGTWADINATYSGVQYNTAATAYTGGIPTNSGFVATNGQGAHALGAGSISIPDKLILSRTYANVRDTFTLAARGLGGASSVYVSINFEEQY